MAIITRRPDLEMAAAVGACGLPLEQPVLATLRDFVACEANDWELFSEKA